MQQTVGEAACSRGMALMMMGVGRVAADSNTKCIMRQQVSRRNTVAST
jgi:hypothetical protein